MLPAAPTYEALTANFAWQIPERYNIGVDVCDKWADGSGRLALIYEQRDGSATRYSFDDLKARSNQFANALRRSGVAQGDRVAIFLPQSPETAIAHLAAYKAGCIAVPLFALFGVDAIQYRLADSASAALITDAAGLQKLAEIRHTLPELKAVYCVDADHAAAASAVHAFWDASLRRSRRSTPRRKIPLSSSIPPAPPANRKARCMRNAFCLGTCLAWSCRRPCSPHRPG
jgi:acetyl-CoA synthetase